MTTPPVMRFVNVGTVYAPSGQAFNFDIELTNRSSYTPADATLNGYTNGCFAQVNLAGNHHVDLRATLLHSCSSGPSCRICTESGYSISQKIACFAAGCSCYGTTVTTEPACSGANAEAARASYNCPEATWAER